ncbi:MAG: hypothetical protein P4L56_08575 [Candidatus Sulfopaludibacter sp.]|nr:hypothetical protein [Candidatus Sulfopaludibacter sp.]
MLRRAAGNKGVSIARQCGPVLLSLLGFLGMASPSKAQITLGPVTVGAGLRTEFETTKPSGGDFNNQFLLDDVRLYINGPITENIKFMFNTDYDGATNKIGVLDAVARIEISSHFNIWAGRFLPPSDRANLYGPFYAHQWGVYTDGIQDGYPFIFQGRDNGVMYWGQFAKKIKVSAGVFDGRSATGNPEVLGAARVQIDFWDQEDGYYLNGTYYGDKNLLAIGGATQYQGGHTATTVDFLMERKLHNLGVVSIESEYSDYNRLGGYDALYAKSQGAYVLGSYLFPKKVGVGKFEILGKVAKADFTHGKNANYDQKTSEANFNYVIKQFNCRVMSFYRDVRFDRERQNFWQAGVGLQVQM